MNTLFVLVSQSFYVILFNLVRTENKNVAQDIKILPTKTTRNNGVQLKKACLATVFSSTNS